ncbi:MAG: hypothetical protein EOM88_02565 [Clostridia bacterium]|jgi:putative phosphoesterase|nr:hypothetical protein [Clostridia bacterium]
MLIAIAADLHDNLANWDILNQKIKKQGIKTLLFCGDLCNDKTLKYLGNSFFEEIYLIAGNAEIYEIESIKRYPNIRYLGRYANLNIDGLEIALIHEPEFKSNVEEKGLKLDFIFYGHSHKAWLEKEVDLIIANPGTLGGVFYPATYATLDTHNKEIKLERLFQ